MKKLDAIIRPSRFESVIEAMLEMGVGGLTVTEARGMRHANSNITMNIYTRAVSSKKRRAQQKVVEMILLEGKNAVVTKGVA